MIFLETSNFDSILQQFHLSSIICITGTNRQQLTETGTKQATAFIRRERNICEIR